MRTLLLLSLAGALLSAPALAGTPESSRPLTVAVVGDTPYGQPQVDRFGTLVDWLNADPTVGLVLHVGDIKNGSSRCDDGYFDLIAGHFDGLEDPLVYTPGDNEWTDCHRANNGAYDPLERLGALRETFFPQPGSTLGGGKMKVAAQADFPENVRWQQHKVAWATLHVVGSNNGLVPIPGETAEHRAQRLSEVAAREAAALEWIDRAFIDARNARGLVLAMQADTETGGGNTGYAAIEQAIEERAAEYGRPVLLLQGDTHRYTVDRPYASAPNLTRIVIEGETIDEYLRLTITPKSEALFSWERVQR